jgi:hypothetical protein
MIKAAPQLLFSMLFVVCLGAMKAKADENDPPAFAYLLHCSGCHLEDGSGAPPIVPDLRSDLGIFLDNEAGRSYMLRVPGVTDIPVGPQQMADLMNWLIAKLYPSRVDFKPFNVDDINAGRKNRLDDPLKYRIELLAKFSANSAIAD